MSFNSDSEVFDSEKFQDILSFSEEGNSVVNMQYIKEKSESHLNMKNLLKNEIRQEIRLLRGIFNNGKNITFDVNKLDIIQGNVNNFKSIEKNYEWRYPSKKNAKPSSRSRLLISTTSDSKMENIKKELETIFQQIEKDSGILNDVNNPNLENLTKIKTAMEIIIDEFKTLSLNEIKDYHIYIKHKTGNIKDIPSLGKITNIADKILSIKLLEEISNTVQNHDAHRKYTKQNLGIVADKDISL